MKKTMQKQGSLSIELLPEFGLLLNGQPVYGPGSVFQGIVHLSLPPKYNAHRLLLVFHGAESIQLHSTMASVIRGRHHQLFGTQRTLWDKTGQDNTSKPNSEYRFTIQMPMIQHPPSMDYQRLRYKCQFKLTAILEQEKKSIALLTAHQTVYYRPWVPTRTLKVPMIRHSKSLMVQTSTTDIVAGEPYQLILTASPDTPCLLKVTIELVQIVTVLHQMHDERIPPSETIMTRSDPIVLSPAQRQPIAIDIPADAAPSYCFGRLITVKYKLALQICWKKRNTKWTTWTCFEDDTIRIPLVIGTLGHGIHVPDDMKHYTDFESLFDHKKPIANCMDSSSTPIVPVPKFLPSIEYEHSPPSYLPCTLPPYDPSTTFCLSA